MRLIIGCAVFCVAIGTTQISFAQRFDRGGGGGGGARPNIGGGGGGGARPNMGGAAARPNIGGGGMSRPSMGAISTPGGGNLRPAQPSTRPAPSGPGIGQSITRPTQPATRPAQPATRPSLPSTLPGQSISRPTQPTTRPAPPTSLPGSGSLPSLGGTGRPQIPNIQNPGLTRPAPGVERPTTGIPRPTNPDLGSRPSLQVPGTPRPTTRPSPLPGIDGPSTRPSPLPGIDRPSISTRPNLPQRPETLPGRPEALPGRPGTLPGRPETLPGRPEPGRPPIGTTRPSIPDRPSISTRPNLPDRPSIPGISTLPGRPITPDRPSIGGNRPSYPDRFPDRYPDRFPDRYPDRFPDRYPDRPVIGQRPSRPVIGGGNIGNNLVIGGGNTNININNNWNNVNNWFGNSNVGWNNGWNNGWNSGWGWNTGWNPGWNSGWGWNTGWYHPSWYNGSWNVRWSTNWYRPAPSFFYGWGLSSWASYTTFVNPYYVPSTTTIYNYSEPIVVSSVASDPGQQSVARAAEEPDADTVAFQLFEEGIAAFRENDFITALNKFDMSLRRLSGNPVLHEMRALTLFALGKYRESAAVLNALLATSPGMDWTTMSGLYSDVSIYTDQLRKLESHIEANPKDAAAMFVLAYHYLVTGHQDDAVALLEEVVQLQPDDTTAAQMLKGLTATPGDATAAATPPAAGATRSASAPSGDAEAADATDDAKQTDLVGKWSATAGDVTILLEVTEESKFSWRAVTKPSDGKPAAEPTELKGDVMAIGDRMILNTESQGAMAGKVQSLGDDQFLFLVAGAPSEDPGLTFNRQK